MVTESYMAGMALSKNHKDTQSVTEACLEQRQKEGREKLDFSE